MPITAKLSRKFYDTFGEELVGELVDWLNQVDATYRMDLREINELNFARFDAKLEQRFAESGAGVDRRVAEFDKRFTELGAEMDRRFIELRAEMDKRFAELRAEMDKRFTELRAEMDERFTELRAEMDKRFADQRADLSSFKSEIIKWMFLFWIGTIAAFLTIGQAVFGRS